MDERYGTGDSVLDLKLGHCVNLYIVLSDRTILLLSSSVQSCQFFPTYVVLILRIEYYLEWPDSRRPWLTLTLFRVDARNISSQLIIM